MAGKQMDQEAAKKMRGSSTELIKLVQARLDEPQYLEPRGEAKTYASCLPEKLRELRAR